MADIIANTSPLLSPCTGVCSMAANGFCRGCWRSMDEIVRWGQLDDGTRLRIMDEVLPRRRQEGAE